MILSKSLPKGVQPKVDAAIRSTIEEEGHEYTDDKDDKPTKFGIIQDDLDECKHTDPLCDLTFEQAYRVYYQKYYVKPNLHHIGSVSPMIAEELFDTRVLMGPRHSVRWLQRTLNAYNWQMRYGDDLTVDGLAGPATARKIAALYEHRGQAEGESKLMFALNAFQFVRMVDISENENDSPPNRLRKYVWGWQDNRAMDDVGL